MSKALRYNEIERRVHSHGFELITARVAGFRPLFAAGAYTGIQQELDRQCLRNASHVVHDTLAHIQERGCMHGRGEGKDEQRQAAEFAAVSKLLAERGDAVLSTQEQDRIQDSRIRYRCSLYGEVGEQASVKIKLRQRHACQRHAASQTTRRAREFALLVDQIQALGIELLTTADTDEGNRPPIPYRKPGRTEILSAPAYWLRAWAKETDRLAA
ncbi:MAG TPA: hypothetical protein PK306_05795 [Aquabacterium sp.]|nr:hypothetical protein [Aquabacterium sp.]